MSTVEDIRQAIQDFLAPELRTITARLDAIDQRFESLRTELALRSEAATAKQDAKLAILDSKIQHVIDLMEVDKRLQKLENQRSENPAA